MDLAPTLYPIAMYYVLILTCLVWSRSRLLSSELVKQDEVSIPESLVNTLHCRILSMYITCKLYVIGLRGWSQIGFVKDGQRDYKYQGHMELTLCCLPVNF